MLCNNFELKCIIFIFSHHRKPNVPSSSQVRKINVNKRRLFLALSRDFSAVSAGSSGVIAASLDRQFHDSADFADLSAASLYSTNVLCCSCRILKCSGSSLKSAVSITSLGEPRSSNTSFRLLVSFCYCGLYVMTD